MIEALWYIFQFCIFYYLCRVGDNIEDIVRSDNGIIRPSPKIIVNTKRTHSPWNNSWGTFSKDTWYMVLWVNIYRTLVFFCCLSGCVWWQCSDLLQFPHNGKGQIKCYPERRLQNFVISVVKFSHLHVFVWF